jgi:plasmid stabilization system protein ParE
LIDFGLAFNEEARPKEFETQTDQGVGNRFVILPEQMGEGADKRDYRSDITQCVGILYFLATGQSPGIINDSSGRKPHRRVDLDRSTIGLSPKERTQLTRILDIGFEWEPSRRWQSIAALAAELRELAQASVDREDVPFEQRLGGLWEKVRAKPENALLARVKALSQELQTAISRTTQQVAGKFHEFVLIQPVFLSGEIAGQRRFGFLIRSSLQQSTMTQVQVSVELEGAELVLDASIHDSPVGFGFVGGGSQGSGQSLKNARIGVFDPCAAALLQTFVEVSLLEAIDRFIG